MSKKLSLPENRKAFSHGRGPLFFHFFRKGAEHKIPEAPALRLPGSALHPLAVGKVRNGHGSAAHGHALLAQAGNTHPCRRIIYVDGRRRARLCGVEERAEYQPVHAVMAAAHAFGQIFFPHRMVVLLTVLLGAVPALVPVKIILVVFAV